MKTKIYRGMLTLFKYAFWTAVGVVVTVLINDLGSISHLFSIPSTYQPLIMAAIGGLLKSLMTIIATEKSEAETEINKGLFSVMLIMVLLTSFGVSRSALANDLAIAPVITGNVTPAITDTVAMAPIITGDFTSALAASTESESTKSVSAALFDTVTTTIINSFMDGLTWSSGYIKSFDGSKQGAAAKASRTVYNWKINKRYTIPITGDLLGTVGHDSMIGGGIGADLTEFTRLQAGVGYAPGGYGWVWSLFPIDLSF